MKEKGIALAGNRTRASRVAGENSTTEPPVLFTVILLRGIIDSIEGTREFRFCQIFSVSEDKTNAKTQSKETIAAVITF